jgi:hypothetical protein
MLKIFKADLHIHTCLSPCAGLDMTPSAIVDAVLAQGIDIIAITDHNSAENFAAAQKAAELTELTVLGGMEVTSSEEAHILAVFDSVENIMAMQKHVYDNMLPAVNDEKFYGDQIVVNEYDEVLDFNRRLLIGATVLNANQIVDTIRALGGLAIASHIDRDFFSITSQLGFIPEDLHFDALEISPLTGMNQAREKFRQYSDCAWVSSSDAHRIEDIGKRKTLFTLESATVEEMKLACMNKEGRKVEWE